MKLSTTHPSLFHSNSVNISDKDGRHRDNVKEVPGDKEDTEEGESQQQETEETKN